MINQGFRHTQLSCLSIYYTDDIKPIDLVKENLDILKYSYVVYHCWTHRDGHGKAIDIFYK